MKNKLLAVTDVLGILFMAAAGVAFGAAALYIIASTAYAIFEHRVLAGQDKDIMCFLGSDIVMSVPDARVLEDGGGTLKMRKADVTGVYVIPQGGICYISPPVGGSR